MTQNDWRRRFHSAMIDGEVIYPDIGLDISIAMWGSIERFFEKEIAQQRKEAQKKLILDMYLANPQIDQDENLDEWTENKLKEL